MDNDLGNGAATTSPAFGASRQSGDYPRPQLVRPHWADLDGVWGFRHDDDDRGLDAGWAAGLDTAARITVPYPPESPASGIGDTGFHRVVWYQRTVTADDLRAAGQDEASPRLLLHFGAVDYRATVWWNGFLLGEHEGGQTPFAFDVTSLVRQAGESTTHTIVVRAEDDPSDVSQPRGKQDWKLDPHSIWYHRTTGIWQTVWLEAVPVLSLDRVRWVPDLPTGSVRVELRLRGHVEPGTWATVALRNGGEPLGTVRVPVTSARATTTVVLPAQLNGQGYEELLWSPETPTLIDATVTLERDGGMLDTIESYLGLRSTAADRGAFLLNDRPYYVRSVLNQGYWPESHLAAPTRHALREEVELIKRLGFNATRVHQKVEDPRFLFWADRLGLLVWGEVAGAFEFSPTAVSRLTKEWIDVVERDVSHPSIVTWVPVNESWGVQHIAHDPAQQAFSRALVDTTKALDPTRPVISNDGWEHQNSDIVSIHDYEASGEVVRARYLDEAARGRLLRGFGPAGRRILLDGVVDRGQPVMLTEFGGVKFAVDDSEADGWGYSQATNAADFAERVHELLCAVQASRFLAGYCYTQLTDTGQEVNGLVGADRTPKIPVERIAAIMRGDD
ncbi:glycoside hydrolase family 2 protein [Frondihabitans cladoniiphilus]|uniref:Glycoside hydrolase family 2 TIM barrel-domain containing protein n=1 Tax=Frondihabitans cladoniiphilus TaxID=715785 RepID=A0ABP8WBJ5_9MICO